VSVLADQPALPGEPGRARSVSHMRVVTKTAQRYRNRRRAGLCIVCCVKSDRYRCVDCRHDHIETMAKHREKRKAEAEAGRG
jgi:hypothetical protein